MNRYSVQGTRCPHLSERENTRVTLCRHRIGARAKRAPRLSLFIARTIARKHGDYIPSMDTPPPGILFPRLTRSRSKNPWLYVEFERMYARRKTVKITRGVIFTRGEK